MKDWISYNWKLISWAIFITVVCSGILLFSLRRDTAEYEKVSQYCLKLVEKIEGIELDAQQAKSIPIGAQVRGASYKGLMMVWEKEISGITVKCSIVSRGGRVKYFTVNGEDKTNIARREERE